MALSKAGYKILEANSASAALEVWSAHCETIDLLVTDFDMAGLTGLQLAQLLRKERPALPVLLMSGRAIDASPTVTFLPKPFLLPTLTDTVHQCLLHHHGLGAERVI